MLVVKVISFEASPILSVPVLTTTLPWVEPSPVRVRTSDPLFSSVPVPVIKSINGIKVPVRTPPVISAFQLNVFPSGMFRARVSVPRVFVPVTVNSFVFSMPVLIAASISAAVLPVMSKEVSTVFSVHFA